MKALLITFLLSYGGAVVAIFNPYVGLLLYIIFANIRPEFLWFWSVPQGGNYSRIIATGLLVGWIMQEYLRWRQREPSAGLITIVVSFALRPVVALTSLFSTQRVGDFGKARLVVAALVAFWFWAILSASLARNEDIALNFVDILSKIVLPVMVGMCLIDNVAKLKALAWTLMLSQGYIAWEMNLTYYEGYNRLYFDGVCGMDNNSASIGMVTAFGLAFFLGIYSERLWQKLLAFGSAALLAHAIMFAMSRGGMLALTITFVVSFLLIRKNWKHYALVAVALLIGLRLAGAEVQDRYFSLFASKEERDASADSRIQLWRACWNVMNQNPLLGVGPDHWPTIAHRHGFSYGKEAHTLWLQLGAETGFVGLGLLLVGYYGQCMLRLLPIARGRLPEGADPWLSYLACAVIASLVGFIISAQFVSLKLLEIPYYVTLIGAGILKLTSGPLPEVVPSVSRNLLPLPSSV